MTLEDILDICDNEDLDVAVLDNSIEDSNMTYSCGSSRRLTAAGELEFGDMLQLDARFVDDSREEIVVDVISSGDSSMSTRLLDFFETLDGQMPDEHTSTWFE